MINYARKLRDEAAKVGAHVIVLPDRVTLSNWWLLDAELAKKMQRVPPTIWRALQAENLGTEWALKVRA